MDLLILAIVLQAFATILNAFPGNAKRSSFYVHLTLITGLCLGIAVSLPAVIYQGSFNNNFYFFPFDKNYFSTDSLSLYFLFIIQLVSIPLTVYSYSYLNHYIEKGRPVKNFLVFYAILLAATQMVVISNHVYLFLICWEVMGTSAFLGIIFEREKKEVRDGGIYYLIISHAAAFLLYIMFFIFNHQSNSWFFSDFLPGQSRGNLPAVLYLLSFISFGIKAGIIPFHFWLPKAHPVAPTVLSALLSGIIVKTGIYGMLRTFGFMPPPPEWFAWSVFVIGMLSAIFGVWYALAQHDIKRLLAYHTVENIGIIIIGIGLGLIGSIYNSAVIQAIGYGGALLHTLNHAIFKSLLFIGSGIVYQNTGTRNIELMGGIVHKSRYFVLFFIIGSAAISGIPPLNGFISEFIIYNGFFSAAKELNGYFPFIMLISTVGLAFVGGLAVACFTKVNSIMFLGIERKQSGKFVVSSYDYFALVFFTLLCIIIGIYPQPFINIINNVLYNNFIPWQKTSVLSEINWLLITICFISIFAGIAVVYIWKLNRQKKSGRRVDAAWGCGYEFKPASGVNPAARFQYTASSFADELNEINQSVLLYHKKIESPSGIFPGAGHFESHSSDLAEKKILLPSFRSFSSAIGRIRFLSHTDIRYYIAFILLTITLYSLIAFLWT
jgi:formate hydrogenlyase subunit 3/multisubunit Na+/H+ antiporter MnhD subunit